MQAILKATIDTALDVKAIKPAEFERILVDTTVQEKAIRYPVDARGSWRSRATRLSATPNAAAQSWGLRPRQAVQAARTRGQTPAHHRGKIDPRGALAKLEARAFDASSSPSTLASLTALLERADRIRTRQRKDKNKLYALHAPEVECISKGKARNRYEFGVKVSLAITHDQGLIVGAKRFAGNPFDGHTLAALITQCNALTQRAGRTVKQAIVDLGYRGVDADNPGVAVTHRGRIKSMSKTQSKLLKRRQAVEPVIGHVKHDHRMIRCHLRGSTGDRVARDGLCGGLQHPLVDAGDAALGPERAFCAPHFEAARGCSCGIKVAAPFQLAILASLAGLRPTCGLI